MASIWFKQARVYELQGDWPTAPDAFEEVLKQKITQPCPKSQHFSVGWMSPFGKRSEVLLHAANGYWLFACCKQERLLPATVVREAVEDRIADIHAEQDRPVSAREKIALREEMEYTLLPQAFTKNQITYAYIDTRKNWLVIDTSADAKCDMLISSLKESIPGLQIFPVTLAESPSAKMTEWLSNNRWPRGFTIEKDCEMTDIKIEKGCIRFNSQELAAKEVVAHLAQGMQVTKLSMSWADKLGFQVDSRFNLTRIKFLDLIEAERKDMYAETNEEKIDADFTLMVLTFSQWFDALITLFGGVANEQTANDGAVNKVETIS